MGKCLAPGRIGGIIQALPAEFLKRMEHLLGEEYPAFQESLGARPITGLRVNRLKLSPESFLAISPFELEPVSWCPDGFRVAGGGQPGKHPYHAAGLYYLQEPSAMAVVELLDPQPGERVLDLAAAPGGKATQIAAKMQNQGLLIANEIHPKRAWELAENLERWGARRAAVLNETPQKLAERFEGYFDRVLLDAPCSGEGMFRKSEAARAEWSPELVRSCSLRQSAILEEAARLVRPGGALVYSTCTFAPEENEGTLAGFLERHPDFELLEAPPLPGFDPGCPDWTPAGGPRAAEMARAVRIWPHRAEGEGHFAARLRRRDGAGTQKPPKPWRPARPPAGVLKLWKEFHQDNLQDHLQDHLASGLPVDGLVLQGSYLYWIPAELPDLNDLRTVHPGWWLGTVKKNRFEPAHALALGLSAGEARRSIRLPANSPETLAYLRGETLTSLGEDGWLLVTVDGFSLGWGRRVSGVIKNYYPKGLRWY